MTIPHVTVVGDVGLDVVAKPFGPIVGGQDTRAQVAVMPGGAGANTAVRLADAGVQVALIARVGADEAGRTATAELAAAGIECRFAVDPALRTCCVVVLVADGDRTMLSDRGANAALAVDDVHLPVVTGRAHLHLSGYVLLDDGSRAAGLAALSIAREAGWTTSVDPQAARHIESVGARRFLSWVQGVDLLLPNDSELEALGGPESALAAATAVVVTHGRDGASWYQAGGGHFDAGAPAAAWTDTTGAGDAFNAGLIAAWLAGADPATALAQGVAAGTQAAGHLGARPPRVSADPGDRAAG